MNFRKHVFIGLFACLLPCVVKSMEPSPFAVSPSVFQFIKLYEANKGNLGVVLPINSCNDLQNGFKFFSKLVRDEGLEYLAEPISVYLIESTRAIAQKNPTQARAMVEENLKNFSEEQQILFREILGKVSSSNQSLSTCGNVSMILFASVMAIAVFVCVNPVVVMAENPEKIKELKCFLDWFIIAFTGKGSSNFW